VVIEAPEALIGIRDGYYIKGFRLGLIENGPKSRGRKRKILPEGKKSNWHYFSSSS